MKHLEKMLMSLRLLLSQFWRNQWEVEVTSWRVKVGTKRVCIGYHTEYQIVSRYVLEYKPYTNKFGHGDKAHFYYGSEPHGHYVWEPKFIQVPDYGTEEVCYGYLTFSTAATGPFSVSAKKQYRIEVESARIMQSEFPVGSKTTVEHCLYKPGYTITSSSGKKYSMLDDEENQKLENIVFVGFTAALVVSLGIFSFMRYYGFCY